jgi:hypothetical protein
MTAIHRPLSSWIAELEDGPSALGPVNYGDHRADARWLPEFTDGWRRTAVELESGSVAMGLVDPEGSVVVELDVVGRPIRITRPGLAALERLEQHWPRVDDALQREIAVIEDEPLPVRYWLAARLGEEGDPPDSVFAILPWDRLELLCATLVRRLIDPDEVLETAQVGHWLTAAVHGLSGPLEQLDEGLRTADTSCARSGAINYLLALRDLPLERVPASTRATMADVARTIGGLDQQFAHLARIGEARLTGRSRADRWRVRLDSRLEGAAAGPQFRQHVDTRGDDDQQVQFAVTRTGLARIVVRIARRMGAAGPLGDPVGTFYPIHLVGEQTGRRTFWVALIAEGAYLTGSIIVPLLSERPELDVDGPPVTPDQLANLPVAALVPSIQLSNGPTRDRWRELAVRLPEHHPVRSAFNRARDARRTDD